MSTAIAAKQIHRMVQRNSRGWGDHMNALREIARRYDLPFGSLDNLRTGRVKTITADLRDAIRSAYLQECERQLAKLQHELATERAKGNIDDDLRDLERQAESLGARLAERRARLDGRP